MFALQKYRILERLKMFKHWDEETRNYNYNYHERLARIFRHLSVESLCSLLNLTGTLNY